MPKLTFLHTAQSNARLFGALVLDLAPHLQDHDEPVHLVSEPLLERALSEGGVTESVRSGLAEIMNAAYSAGADMVVCTCSTLGEAAEEIGQELGKPVLRIDRPMAEVAVRARGPLLVAACVATTVDPTTQLLKQVASEQGVEVPLTVLLMSEAWELFEAGEKEAYERAIADELRDLSGDYAAIVLAQASMAGAVRYCQDLNVPVLSSPNSGVKEALRRLTR